MCDPIVNCCVAHSNDNCIRQLYEAITTHKVMALPPHSVGTLNTSKNWKEAPEGGWQGEGGPQVFLRCLVLLSSEADLTGVRERNRGSRRWRRRSPRREETPSAARKDKDRVGWGLAVVVMTRGWTWMHVSHSKSVRFAERRWAAARDRAEEKEALWPVAQG